MDQLILSVIVRGKDNAIHRLLKPIVLLQHNMYGENLTGADYSSVAYYCYRAVFSML